MTRPQLEQVCHRERRPNGRVQWDVRGEATPLICRAGFRRVLAQAVTFLTFQPTSLVVGVKLSGTGGMRIVG